LGCQRETGHAGRPRGVGAGCRPSACAGNADRSFDPLLSADFQFRYGEGWFVGPFGAAADARWHLGSLASFAAWMVLLPDSRQAVAVFINTNTDLPFGEVSQTDPNQTHESLKSASRLQLKTKANDWLSTVT